MMGTIDKGGQSHNIESEYRILFDVKAPDFEPVRYLTVLVR